jgi:hypothetical protein
MLSIPVAVKGNLGQYSGLSSIYMYVARPQSKFPTRPTASKPDIERSDCAHVIEQGCSMANALTAFPAFPQ